MKTMSPALISALLICGLSGCAATDPVSNNLFDLPLELHFQPMDIPVYSLTHDGVLQAHIDDQRGYLIMKNRYADFRLTLDYSAEYGANSGVYIRCQNAGQISSRSCYEINIADQHNVPESRTGSIVGYAPPEIVIDATGRWNTMTISAQGPSVTVWVNDEITAKLEDESYSEGYIALQYGGHSKDIRFRNFTIKGL